MFCGKANEPTLNHIAMAEDLATGHSIPLGKYLLGSVYHMLYQTTHLMHQPEDLLCQWPLVVCTNVAATIYAPDCWC
jgi:hypothetical protein